MRTMSGQQSWTHAVVDNTAWLGILAVLGWGFYRDWILTVALLGIVDVWLTASWAAMPRSIARIFHQWFGRRSEAATLWCGRNEQGDLVRRVTELCGCRR